jgi:hypothetical protein
VPQNTGWVHLATVRKSNVLRHYMNGGIMHEVLSYPYYIGQASVYTYIGVQKQSGTLQYYHKGNIDTLGLWIGDAKYWNAFNPPTVELDEYFRGLYIRFPNGAIKRLDYY